MFIFIYEKEKEHMFIINFFNFLLEELEQDLIVTMNPHALVDGNLSSVWAFPIIEGKNVHIDIDLHSTYAVSKACIEITDI